VLKNLLANALKFTDSGSVRLVIHLADEERFENPTLHRAGAVVAFAVIDTGLGIVPEKQKLIFEAFQQADGTTSRRYGGTGLGLSISRELARLLGGEIHVSSALGQGSTFTLYLPDAYLGAEPAADDPPGERLEALPRERSPSDDAIAGTRVLVVDDDPRNIFAITSALESHGVDVLNADNGEAGIAALAQHPDIDLVLMDVMMPGMDGYETMRAIRADPRHESLPIIALTAKALKDDRQRCIDAGASDYLPKPVDTKRLLAAVRLWSCA
jgi:CheY-like chemotaxis protein